MSRHVTYRGATLDMDSIRRENEHVAAIGNQKVNARGDQIAGGQITKTAEQIARENHRATTTTVVNAGLKGKMPAAPATMIEPPKTDKTVAAKSKKTKEVELPSGDIVIEDEKE
jgi:hypothetical protein